jgi:predicted GTPase
VLERNAGLTHAEATLAADAIAQGRALILCLNKVDMASRKELQSIANLVQKDIEDVTPEVGSATILPMSALNGVGTQELLPKIISAYSQWNRRISTGKLNSWLRKEIVKYMEGGGKDISRIKYLSQVKSRPPTFVAFLSGKAQLGESTQRFIANKLRQEFSLDGVPLRILFRRSLT